MGAVTDAQRAEPDEPHDVLAAEEFGIGTRDERYPADPSGIDKPHDVLAAEEFPMPSGGAEHHEGTDPRSWAPLVILTIALAALAWTLFRRQG
jgi:hypothetical protein